MPATKIFGHRHFSIFVSIDFRYIEQFVGSRSTIQHPKAVWFLTVLITHNITGNIYIPPSAIIVNAVSGMGIGSIGIGCSVNDIAGNVLTAAERGEQMGEVKAKPFLRAECLAHVKILDEGISLKVIFKV